MTKHIVNIVPAFIAGDGIGNSARARVKGLLEGGYQVTVVCATGTIADDEFPGLKLLQAGAGWEAERSSLTTEMFAAVRSADLVFVEFGCFNICHELLHQVAAPLILFYQGITPSELMQNDMYTACYWRAIGELRKMPKPAMVLAASQFTLGEYARNAGHKAPKSRVVPLFGNTRDTAASLTLNGRRPFKVLTVGQLFPHKNYEVLIEATKLLVSDGLDVEVSHIGGANDLIALNYRRKLQSIANTLGDRFKFLGRVEQGILDKAYADAHVVVIPSLHEGYSLPVREALIHGKPVIGSSFGAIPETLQGVGRLFHPLDAVQLAKLLAEYAAMDGSNWTREYELAKATAASHSQERYARGCIEAIEEVLSDQSIDLSRLSNVGPQRVIDHEYVEDAEDYISGKLRFSQDPSIDLSWLTLEALVTSANHVVRTKVGVRTTWLTQGQSTDAICTYELSLVGMEDCTSVYLHFVNSQTGNREWRLGGFQRERTSCSTVSAASQELERLSLAIAESFSPKSVVAADRRLLTRFKTKVANTILKLVYHVFTGPQMAAMQSQKRLFALIIDDLKRIRIANTHESGQQREQESSQFDRDRSISNK